MGQRLEGVPIRYFSEVLHKIIETSAAEGNVAKFARLVNSACRHVLRESEQQAISTQQLHKYLAGSEPGLDKLRYIAIATGISIAHLAGIPSERADRFKYYIRYYPNIWEAELYKSFEQAENAIDLLLTRPDFLLDPVNRETLEGDRYIDLIKSIAKDKPHLRIRILLLQPESLFSRRREDMLVDEPLDELGIRKRRSHAWSRIERIMKIADNIGERFHVKLYDTLPTRVTTRIDDWMFYSPVTHNKSSRECTVFKLHLTMPSVMDTFYDHFVSIWHKAQTITRAELDLVHQQEKKEEKDLVSK